MSTTVVESPQAPSRSTDPREPLHQLNGRLIRALTRLIDGSWDEWIVNAIMLHRSVAAVETVTLETSATLHHGTEYFSRRQCGPDKPVRNLDGPVPLNDSYAGHCIREDNVVWVNDVAKKVDPLKYRGFAYVGVLTERPVQSEYVFPIRLRTGLSSALLGVLNCEWYGSEHAATRNMFQEMGHTLIAYLVTNLLDVHARFLPIALDQIEAPAGNWNTFLNELYEPSINEHIGRIKKEVSR